MYRRKAVGDSVVGEEETRDGGVRVEDERPNRSSWEKRARLRGDEGKRLCLYFRHTLFSYNINTVL